MTHEELLFYHYRALFPIKYSSFLLHTSSSACRTCNIVLEFEQQALAISIIKLIIYENKAHFYRCSKTCKSEKDVAFLEELCKTGNCDTNMFINNVSTIADTNWNLLFDTWPKENILEKF